MPIGLLSADYALLGELTTGPCAISEARRRDRALREALGRLRALKRFKQRLLRDARQHFQTENAALRGLQKPLGHERAALVIAAIRMVFENLFEHKLEAYFETVSNRH
jgi:hypothetical protein